MATTLMRGPTGLRNTLAAFLQPAMEQHITWARAQHGLTQYQLPFPTKYDAVEPYAADAYPLVGCYILSDRTNTVVDFDDTIAGEYRTTYATRLFVSVLTPVDAEGRPEMPAYDAAVRLRDDLTTMLRATLLNEPSLGVSNAEVDMSTLTTDYPEPISRGNQRASYIASGLISVDVKYTESTYVPKLGDMETFEVEVEKLVP